MDLRGIAKLSNSQFIICGGMDSTQTVNGRTFLLENTTLDLTSKNLDQKMSVLQSETEMAIELSQAESIRIYDMQGRIIFKEQVSKHLNLDKSKLPKGMLIIQSDSGSQKVHVW